MSYSDTTIYVSYTYRAHDVVGMNKASIHGGRGKMYAITQRG